MISVILMAYGSPSRMEDVIPYLEGIYEGKPVPEYAIRENTEKYAMANGVSPSNAIIERIVSKLEKELSAHGEFKVVLGNKHWNPSLVDALKEAKNCDSEKVVCIPLFPFQSTNVRNSYLEPTLSALKSLDLNSEVKFINGFTPEELSTMWVSKLKNYDLSDDAAVLFDAHSLPLFGSKESEYDQAFHTTADLISEKLGIKKHFTAYQSRGKYGKDWLEPSIYDALETILKGDYREVLTIPIGFIYEHLEILYDLDHEFGSKVQKNGLIYVRSELPNDTPSFISILKNHVLKETGELVEQS